MVLHVRVIYGTLFFVMFMTLLAVSRPPWLFQKDGTVIPFGVGPGKTLFSLGSVTVACALLSIFAFALIDLVCATPMSPSR